MTIATVLTSLDTQRKNLAANLTAKGVASSDTETLTQLVPKVLNISGDGGLSTPPLTSYTPPSDWINIDSIVDGNINFLVADTDTATFAFRITVDAGTVQVNWGDGNSTIHNSGVVISHTYAVGTGQPCSRGYTTFKMVISPSANCKITKFELAQIPGFNQSQFHGYLRCVFAATNCTTFLQTFYLNSTISVMLRRLEEFKTVGTFPLITTTSCMFFHCTALKKATLDGLTALTVADNMFNDCIELESVTFGSNFNTVTDVSGMFYNCRSLKYVDTSNLTGVLDSSSMFNGCYNLRSVDITKMTSITDATNMFYQCYALNNVKFGSKPYMTTTTSMFNNCYGLCKVDLDQLSAVTTASSMFTGCYGLENVDISGMTSLVTATNMFYNCAGLRNINMGSIPTLTNISTIFYQCYSLISVNIGSMPVLDLAGSMFQSCTSLQSVDISGLTAISSASSMFNSCASLTDVIVGDKPLLTNATSMFNGCSSLQKIDISGLTAVTVATTMFNNCFALKYLTATNFGLNSVGVNAQGMFYQCEQLLNVNMSNAKVTRLDSYGASGKLCKLKTIIYHPSSPFSGSGPQLNLVYNDISAADIDAIFTALPTLTGKSISITGCTGAATCTRSIATAKGWTVTG